MPPRSSTAGCAPGTLGTRPGGLPDHHRPIKELINRGGEKISPTEIDDVLLAHPAVADAAAFGVPDPKYGEEVQAAVVLKGDADAESCERYCLKHLADFKVPKVIRIVSELPKNEMGKVDRRALTALYSGTG